MSSESPSNRTTALMFGEGTGGMSASYSGPAIVFATEGPALHEQSFAALTAEQRGNVNQILKETHERYLKDEALHSRVFVDAGGTQTTEISAFPDQLRAIENEMWTKLDDAVQVETQKQFRDHLNLFHTVTDPAARDSYGGRPNAENSEPGLLGWDQSLLPITMRIGRSGRWYDWSGSFYTDHALWEIPPTRAPILPVTLHRYLREPGPWMAVANARATYAAKNWIKLSDYFTADAMTREWIIGMVDVERLSESAELNAEVWNRFSQRLEEETRSPENAEMVRIGSGEENKQSDFNNTHLRPLMSELAGLSATDFDASIQRVTKEVPLQTLKQHFGWTVLTRWLVTEQGLDRPSDFAALHGEVSSYTETGDTASATLTIPDPDKQISGVHFKSFNEIDYVDSASLTIPIRFKRENGQWKIDAIGSNERLLDRLKQTIAWKQHAEIEAVLENARTAYAAKEWQKLADSFTPTGKYRWILRTHAMLPTDASPVSEDVAMLHTETFRTETKRSEIQQAAAGKTNEKLPKDGYGKESRILLDQFLTCPTSESEAMLIKFTESLPESLLDWSFALSAIQSIVEPPQTYRFDFDGSRIANLKSGGENATANLVRSDDTPPVPVRFVKLEGQWKIDAIGTSEELQQQVKTTQERQNGDSPRAAVEAFRQAMADGRFETALNCMTEDARNEWLGEMLVGYVSAPGNDHGRAGVWFTDDEVNSLHQAKQGPEYTEVSQSDMLAVTNSSVSAAERRKLAIELVKHLSADSQRNRIVAFLVARFQNRPEMYEAQWLGEFQEIPVLREGAKVTIYCLQPTTPDQPPLELDIIQIDGLWKLNTIIDPAMKPWPLPVEEPAPPAEPAPVDGATGVP